MYDRQIDATSNLVFYAKDKAMELDCSPLREAGIVMVCQQQGEIWVERQPFQGRETDFDVELVEWFFKEAEAAALQEEKRFEALIERSWSFVPKFALSRAIFEKDYVLKYTEWVNAPTRTFLEQEFIKYEGMWDRESDIYKGLIGHMGLSPEEEKNLFLLAKSY